MGLAGVIWAGARRRSIWSGWGGRLTVLRTFFLDAAVVLILPVMVIGLAGFAVFIFDELSGDRVVMGDVNVPEKLAKDGLTPTVVKQRLLAEIRQIQIDSGSQVSAGELKAGGSDDLALIDKSPLGSRQLTLSPTGLSLNDLLSLILAADRFLGSPFFNGKIYEIDVDITRLDDEAYCIALRVNGRMVRYDYAGLSAPPADGKAGAKKATPPNCRKDNGIDDLFAAAAAEIVWVAQPYYVVSRDYKNLSPNFYPVITQALKNAPAAGRMRGRMVNLHALYYLRRDAFRDGGVPEPDKARDILESAMWSDPDAEFAPMNLAVLYLGSYDDGRNVADLEKAREFIAHVLQRNPRQARAQALYGYVLTLKVQAVGSDPAIIAEAASHIDEAMRLGEETAMVYYCRGLLRAASARIGPDPETPFLDARADGGLPLLMDAFQFFERAAELGGSFPAEERAADVLFRMGALQNDEAPYRKALQWLSRAGNRNLLDPHILTRYANGIASAGRADPPISPPALDRLYRAFGDILADQGRLFWQEGVNLVASNQMTPASLAERIAELCDWAGAMYDSGGMVTAGLPRQQLAVRCGTLQRDSMLRAYGVEGGRLGR